MRNPAQTRERLLETAIALIWQSNYSDVGVNEICKQAGVTKGAFYHHFKSKADLFYDATQHYWDGIKKDLDAIYAPHFTALEQLENLIALILDHQNRRAELHPGPIPGCPFFTAGGQAGIDEEKVRQAAREMADHALAYMDGSRATPMSVNSAG